MGKCPKCSATFPESKAGYKAFKHHYYERHVPATLKAKKGKQRVYKEPTFVKFMKGKR